MRRLKIFLGYLFLAVLLSNGIVARRINNTIYDTNTAHITYEPREDFCAKWRNNIFWRTCEIWANPWRSEVYQDQGKVATFHRSLDHELSSMIIEFEGSAVWIYGPPRSQLFALPVEYKICLHENHRMASDAICYRVDVAEAYSDEDDYGASVLIFAKGGLQYHEHRIVITLAEPTGDLESYHGIQFSHAVYTTERPTPWPVDEDAWRFRQVIMHDTHPLLSYWPREPVPSGSWRTPFLSGWSAKVYTAEDGTRVSWHELRSRDEEGRNGWGVDATITAGAVALYGVPKAHITDTDYLSPICVRIDSGSCEIVDVKHAYLNAEHHQEAVLIWRNDALDSDRKTHVAVRLAEVGDQRMTVFPFKEFRYFEKQEYSSPDLPVGHIQTISVPHDNEAVIYHPGRRCLTWTAWWCSQWFDPWVWKETSGGITYRSTVWSYRESEDPSITLEFQGSEVYVYGAPKSLVRGSFASQHVCINDVCHLVDTEQAYLNAPGGPVESATSNVTSEFLSPELEPVLLWSQKGLNDQLHHTLRFALAPLHSEDDSEMTIAKVTYAKTLGQSRPDTPVPPPDDSYQGPLFPPHSVKWAPRPPPPPKVPEPAPQPTPVPNPTPEPPVSQPDPSHPSTSHPPKGDHPTISPPRSTPPPSSHPTPPSVPEPEIPFSPGFIGWLLCLFGLASVVAVKRYADRRARGLQGLLSGGFLRVDTDNYRRYWGAGTGDGGSTIYGGTSNYGGTSHGGATNNYRRAADNGGSSTYGGTATLGNATQNYGPPPSYTQPPSYHPGQSALSGTSTNLPSYPDVAREQRIRALRTAAFVAQQRTTR